jgi:RNA polymerase sigma-70 factor (ECF subfamily)
MFRFSLHRKNTKSDQELLRLYRRTGEIRFMGELYDRYTHVVYGTCLKYLKNREESKDAVMQIFEKTITEGREKEIKNFQGWIYVVSRNFCLMKLRNLKTIRDTDQVELDSVNFFMEYPEDLHHNDRMHLDEKSDTLNKCLDGLAEEQKRCIVLFYFEDKCYQEIARMTGYELKKVKSYLQNGKRNLKNCMDTKHVRKSESS